MADGYDRFDNEGSGGGSFVMGLLTGTVLGAGLGMLFAPKAGSELRGQLSEQAGQIANTASEQYRRASEAATGWAEKGRETYDKAADKGREAYDKAADKGREAFDKARDAVSRGTEEAQRYVRDATSGAGSSSSPFGGPDSTSGSRRS